MKKLSLIALTVATLAGCQSTQRTYQAPEPIPQKWLEHYTLLDVALHHCKAEPVLIAETNGAISYVKGTWASEPARWVTARQKVSADLEKAKAEEKGVIPEGFCHAWEVAAYEVIGNVAAHKEQTRINQQNAMYQQQQLQQARQNVSNQLQQQNMYWQNFNNQMFQYNMQQMNKYYQ
ncbi:hypothetical protein [Vibrio sp. B181a]|uniref:hypothetical protein n=1 Tax=Vibrio sp. B181a TaxID=2835906 RepID=UPI002555851A|nr:hypothetical protein [Vibrio sp. B181a]MDK9774691.1 hypothetical protein [Vibrio sp. B181a]